MEYRNKLVEFYGGINKTFVHLKSVEKGLEHMLKINTIDNDEYKLRIDLIKKFKKQLQLLDSNENENENLQ